MVPGDKVVDFLEASLAAAVADRPVDPPAWDSVGARAVPPRDAAEPSTRLTPAADPDITAVNAAFALALCERHDLLGADHRLYDLAHAAASDAPDLDFEAFKRQFEALAPDPDESEFRKALVGATKAYLTSGSSRAAD